MSKPRTLYEIGQSVQICLRDLGYANQKVGESNVTEARGYVQCVIGQLEDISDEIDAWEEEHEGSRVTAAIQGWRLRQKEHKAKHKAAAVDEQKSRVERLRNAAAKYFGDMWPEIDAHSDVEPTGPVLIVNHPDLKNPLHITYGTEPRSAPAHWAGPPKLWINNHDATYWAVDRMLASNAKDEEFDS